MITTTMINIAPHQDQQTLDDSCQPQWAVSKQHDR